MDRIKAKNIDEKYPLLSLLTLHLKIGDEKKWAYELSDAMKNKLRAELHALLESVAQPESHWKERMLFFQVFSDLFQPPSMT